MDLDDPLRSICPDPHGRVLEALARAHQPVTRNQIAERVELGSRGALPPSMTWSTPGPVRVGDVGTRRRRQPCWDVIGHADRMPWQPRRGPPQPASITPGSAGAGAASY